MASRPTNARELQAACTRIIGAEPRFSNETLIYRIEAISREGDLCPINLQIGKRTFFDKQSIHQVADHLRVRRSEVDQVWDWTLDDVLANCRRFSTETLKSRFDLRRFEQELDAEERT